MRFVAALLGLIALSAPAHAVTYALEDVTYNQAAQTWTLLPAPPISVTITQAAVDRGSFAFHASTGPLTTSGDVSDLVAFRIGGMTLDRSGFGVLYSHLDIALQFAPDGSVTSGTIGWLSDTSEFTLSGNANAFGGTFSLSDSSACGTNSSPVYDCRLSGVLVDPPDPAPLPEPRTVALIALPLLGLGLAQAYAAFASRRRAWRIHSV